MIEGSSVRLRVVERRDAEYLRRLRNAPAVSSCFIQRRPITDVQQESFLQRLAEDDTRLYFVGEARNDDTPFGVFHLSGIDHAAQHAQVGTFLDPDRDDAPLLVFEAVVLLYDFAFHTLNLHKLCAEVLAANHRAVRLNEAVGMRREGQLREHVFREGRFEDVLLYALFREDFDARPTPVVQRAKQWISEKDRQTPLARG